MNQRLFPDCDQEPIHIPGQIQAHGFLVAIDSASRTIRRISENVQTYLGVDGHHLLGKPFDAIFDDAVKLPPSVDLSLAERAPSVAHALQRPIELHGQSFNISFFNAGDELVVEFERSESAIERTLDDLYPDLYATIEKLQVDQPLHDLYQLTAEAIRRITGFDRTLIYRFDEHWDGNVVGEARNDLLPSYMDLRFPAGDIPAQARALYRQNRTRQIPDVNYEPVRILDDASLALPTLDMTFSVLRSVSPVHVQYMRNMATPASMSISILVQGELWGLIACHHAEARAVGPQARAACDLVAQMLSVQLTAHQRNAHSAERLDLQLIQARLLGFMAQEKIFVHGLSRHPEDFLAVAVAAGAAVVFEDQCLTAGDVPDNETIKAIVDWLSVAHADRPVFATSCLPADMAEVCEVDAAATGLLAISISQIHRSYVLWFRPEVIQTVKWGGDPRKTTAQAQAHLSPRVSFQIWKETRKHTSLAWTDPQFDTVRSLRESIIGIVMRKAEELADLTDELKRSNKELEAFSYSVSHDLRAPFRHIVGYAELLKEIPQFSEVPRASRYIETIIESAQTAGKLVDGLLGFSQTGRTTLSRQRVDINRVVRDCQNMLIHDLKDREVVWDIGPLGSVEGDMSLLRQVFQNLLGNAVKYSRDRDVATITIRREDEGKEMIFSVADNGVGFDMRYVSKLFGVFQRLHRMEEFEGTGIGLANVKRIMERHGGRAWAVGTPGTGATFFISFPRRGESKDGGA